MEHGFGHSVKEQSDAHPRAKQHGKPAWIGEFGLGVRPPDAKPSKGRYQNPNAGGQHDVHGQHQKPSGIFTDPPLYA